MACLIIGLVVYLSKLMESVNDGIVHLHGRLIIFIFYFLKIHKSIISGRDFSHIILPIKISII